MSVSDNWEVGSLLVNCFLRMDLALKQRFNELIDKKIIDRILWGMIQDGLFPAWFIKEMSFDPSQGQLNGLREGLSTAAEDHLMDTSGSNFNYRFFDFTNSELEGMSSHVGLDEQEVVKLAKELNARLFKAA